MGCGSVRACSDQIQQTVEPSQKGKTSKQAWGHPHQACSSSAGPPRIQSGHPAAFDPSSAEGVLPGPPTSPPPSVTHQVHGSNLHPNAISTTPPPGEGSSTNDVNRPHGPSGLGPGHGLSGPQQQQQQQKQHQQQHQQQTAVGATTLGIEGAPMSLAERSANYELRLAARRNREQKKKSKKFSKAFLSNVPEVEADIALHFNFWVAGPAAEVAIEAACRSPAAKAMQQGRQDQQNHESDEPGPALPTISSRSNSPMPHLGPEASTNGPAATATTPAAIGSTSSPSPTPGPKLEGQAEPEGSQSEAAMAPSASQTLPAGLGTPKKVGEEEANEDVLLGPDSDTRPKLERQNSGPRAPNACKTMPASPSATSSSASPTSPATLSLSSPTRRSLGRRPDPRPGTNRCLVQIDEGAAASSGDSKKVAKLSFTALGFDEDAPARFNHLEALSSVIVFAFFVDGPVTDIWGTLEDQLEYMETSVRRLKASTKAALRPARALLLCHRDSHGGGEEVEDWATALAEFEKVHGVLWKLGPVCPEEFGGAHDDAVYAAFSELAAARAAKLSAQAAEESGSDDSEEPAAHFRSTSSLDDSHRPGPGSVGKERLGKLDRMDSSRSEPMESKGRRLSCDSDQSLHRDSFPMSECSDTWTAPYFETERSAVESLVGTPDQMYPTGSTGSYSSRRLSPNFSSPVSNPLTPTGSNTLALPGARAPGLSEGAEDGGPRSRQRPDPGVSYSSFSSSAMGEPVYGSNFTGTSAGADFLPEQSMRSADSMASTAPDRSLMESRANVFSTEQSGSSVSSSAYELHIRTFGGAARPVGPGTPTPTNHSPL